MKYNFSNFKTALKNELDDGACNIVKNTKGPIIVNIINHPAEIRYIIKLIEELKLGVIIGINDNNELVIFNKFDDKSYNKKDRGLTLVQSNIYVNINIINNINEKKFNALKMKTLINVGFNGIFLENCLEILKPSTYGPIPKKLDLEEACNDRDNIMMYLKMTKAFAWTPAEACISKENVSKIVKIFAEEVANSTKKPLTEAEIDEIDETLLFFNKKDFVKVFMDDKNKEHKVFEADLMADFIFKTQNVIKIEGLPYVYNGKTYDLGGDFIEGLILDCDSKLPQKTRKEVLSQIKLKLIRMRDTEEAPSELICFQNGILNIETGDFTTDFSPYIVFRNCIPHNYNPNAKCDIVDKTLKKIACNDDDILQLLKEAAGYSLFRRNELRKSFLLTGGKSNGKSTYLAMIASMIGRENLSNISLSELADRFTTARMVGKLANIGDDIPDGYIQNLDVFKKLVSGDPLKAERKGENAFDFTPYCKLYFSANNLPRLNDKTGAVASRLIMIPFNAVFSKNDPDFDPFIKTKLTSEEACERLIVLGLEALQKVLKKHEFTSSQKSKNELDEYNKLNNPIVLFFEDEFENDKNNLIGETISEIYGKYLNFCITENLKSYGKSEFQKILKSTFNLKVKQKRVNGDRVYILVEELDDNN